MSTSTEELYAKKKQEKELRREQRRLYEIECSHLTHGKYITYLNGWTLGKDRVEIFFEDKSALKKRYIVMGKCFDNISFEWFFNSKNEAFDTVKKFYGKYASKINEI